MDISRLDHVAVTVKDLTASFSWYEKVFGFSIFHKWTTTWMIIYRGIRIGLFQRPTASRVDDLDNKIAIQHFAFLTDPEGFRRAQDLLTSLGVPFDGPEDTGVAKSIFVSDPDGHQVELTYYYAAGENVSAG